MQLPQQSPPQSRMPARRIDPAAAGRTRSSCAARSEGVVPAGPERCYNLRGPAQQMCFLSYY